MTKANYDKIQTGMALEEVEGILGSGTKEGGGEGVAAQFGVHVPTGGRGGSGETYVWEEGSKSIRVRFVQGKVAGKSESGL